MNHPLQKYFWRVPRIYNYYMSCNILIWKQWDSNLVSNVTGNHILIVLHKDSFWMSYMYMYITQSTTHYCQLLYQLYSTVYIKSGSFVFCLCICYLKVFFNFIKNNEFKML